MFMSGVGVGVGVGAEEVLVPSDVKITPTTYTIGGRSIGEVIMWVGGAIIVYGLIASLTDNS